MTKTISKVELLEILRKRIDQCDSQLQFANQIGVSPQYLSDVILGRREPGPKIYDALGFGRLTVYYIIQDSQQDRK